MRKDKDSSPAKPPLMLRLCGYLMGNLFYLPQTNTLTLYPQIYRYDIGSQQITRVTQTGKTNAMARVSPNGRFISFVANNDQGMLMALASNATIAINNEGLAEPANFSADGNYLVFLKKSVKNCASA